MESMSLTPQTPNDPFYLSAPATPRRFSLEGLCFFSVPTSPTRRNLKAAYDLDTEPTTPNTSENSSSSNVDEFEFETSRRFNVDEYEVASERKFESQSGDPHQIQNHGHKESLPAMAFADELFADGKVMPLKPPPRLQYPNNDKKFDKQSSTLSSPRSPTGVLRLPFQRRSLWNDDFDPFMAALKNVKEEKVGKSQAKNHRRSRSMSPFREPKTPKETSNLLSGSSQQQINQMGLILPTKQSESNSNKRIQSNESTFLMWVPDQNRQMVGRQEQVKQEVKKSSIKLAEPKGVLFARKARLVKAGHENPRKPSMMTSTMAAAAETAKETKGKKIKDFLFRSVSMRKTRTEDKPKSSNATESRPPKPNLRRKFSFKSMGITEYNEEKRVSEASRMTLIQYRPKLLLCMGYGAKSVQ